MVQGFEQALGVKLPDTDLIARLALAYLDSAPSGSTAPRTPASRSVSGKHDRFFAHLRRLIALDVMEQIRSSGLKVDPSRLPTRL